MNNSLFRTEAIEHQRNRLWGEVILIQPVSYLLMIIVIAVALSFILVFLASNNYARKESISGYLKAENAVVQVYSDQSGVLEKILVEAGQVVRKGEPIAKVRLTILSSTGVDTQQKIQLSKQRELENIAQLIHNSFEQQQHEKQAIVTRIGALESELSEQNNALLLLAEGLKLAEQHRQNIENLMDNGFASKRLFEERQIAVLQAKQQLAGARKQKLTLQNLLAEAQNSKRSLHFHYLEIRANFNMRKESLNQQLATINQSDGYTILSPIDGKISTLLVNEGSNIRMNLPLLTISPIESKLYAQLLVPSRAIGLIKPKQRAKIQYDAFPYQRFGVFGGKIEQVSESIFIPSDLILPVPIQESFYLVKLSIDKQTIDIKGQAVPLKTGMVLKADITLENRSIMQWILDPILSFTNKS